MVLGPKEVTVVVEIISGRVGVEVQDSYYDAEVGQFKS
jgi:hypothetical protein